MFSQKFSDFTFFGLIRSARVIPPDPRIGEILAFSTETSSHSLKTTNCSLSEPSLPKSASLPYLFNRTKESSLLVTISEAARKYLHVSRSTVYRLAEQGAIQIVHVRGCARVTVQSIERYLEELTGGYR